MEIKFCRYCENNETDMSLMYFYYNYNSKLIIDNIHYSCKLKEDSGIPKIEIPKEIKIKVVKIVKCKYCDIHESEDIKITKGMCVKCRDIRRLATKKKYQDKVNAKAREETRLKQLDSRSSPKKKSIMDRISDIPEQKRCTCCDEIKHISYYYHNKRFIYSARCKSCQNKKTSAWRIKNKEKEKEYQKEYQKTYKRKRS